MPRHSLQVYEPITSCDELCNPNGIWKIETEGDVEGRGTQLVGIFEGNIIDILTVIHEKCYYNFFVKKFKKVEKTFNSTKKPNSLKVYVDNIYDKTSDEIKKINDSLFKRDNTFIRKNYGSSVLIYLDEDAKIQESKERKEKIKKALSKLTKEEKELLGIIDRS